MLKEKLNNKYLCKCETCKFRDEDECRKNPPSVIMMVSMELVFTPKSVWPIIRRYDDYCWSYVLKD